MHRSCPARLACCLIPFEPSQSGEGSSLSVFFPSSPSCGVIKMRGSIRRRAERADGVVSQPHSLIVHGGEKSPCATKSTKSTQMTTKTRQKTHQKTPTTVQITTRDQGPRQAPRQGRGRKDTRLIREKRAAKTAPISQSLSSFPSFVSVFCRKHHEPFSLKVDDVDDNRNYDDS